MGTKVTLASVLIYTAFDPPPKVGLDCGFDEEGNPLGSMTRESEAAACDVNAIVARAQMNGFLPGDPGRGVFADVSEMGDYRSALQQVQAAEEMFMQLPAKVRAEFDNDPAAFLDFCSDPANLEKGRQLGLFPKEEVPLAPPVAAPQAPVAPSAPSV